MSESPFDPNKQSVSLSAKITAGLERISGVFRTLLWEHAKNIGLSPIQIQLLIFVSAHPGNLGTVSHLAREFDLSKPTISDAVRVLAKKELIRKIPSTRDKRAYGIVLTQAGQSMVKETELFASPLEKSIDKLTLPEKEQLFFSLKQLIFTLHKTGVISVQRSCFGCRFYSGNNQTHYCQFLEQNLKPAELRIDCPEFEKA
ncbi:MAG: MarR family transcriptional regulator [Bacteroidetes bacterium]|nr:MarR family transcriptional regulator [Bacteroidota bacterium]